MLLKSWLRSFCSVTSPSRTSVAASGLNGRRKQTPPPRRQPLGCPLHVEALEDRCLPSTFTVLNLNDGGPGSLRQAVAEANALGGADTIEFAPGLKGTVSLTSGELAITDSLTIDGPGAGKLALSGNNSRRVFHVTGSTTAVAIFDLTIADGLATGNVALGGGIRNDGGHLSAVQVMFSDNHANGNGTSSAIAGGGAIANVYGGTLTITASTFTGNQSMSPTRSAGGAILNDAGSSVTIVDSTFTGNVTTGRRDPGGFLGAAGGAVANLGTSTAMVSDSTFTGNRARGGDDAPGPFYAGLALGGAISNSQISLVSPSAGGSSLTVSHSHFLENEARGGDGGSGVGGPGGGGAGGAISNDLGSIASVIGSEFRGNRAIGGSGDHTSSNLAGGRGGEGAGGAISNFRAMLTVQDSAFIENLSAGGAGGNSLALGGTGGKANGGAISSFNAVSFPGIHATAHLVGVTLTGNQAIGGPGGDGGPGQGGNGGEVWGGALTTDSTMSVSNSTLNGNQATGGAGGSGLTLGNGGWARGGGIANLAFIISGGLSNLTVSGSLMKNNQVIGGSGAVGSFAEGGGIFTGAETGAHAITLVSDTTIVKNQTTGGEGVVQGGDGQGGGIFNGSGSSLGLLDSLLTKNLAEGGNGLTPGHGVGGGLYNAVGGTACVDVLTAIFANEASTSDDDVFGDLCSL
jgi:hypothetical protein